MIFTSMFPYKTVDKNAFGYYNQNKNIKERFNIMVTIRQVLSEMKYPFSYSNDRNDYPSDEIFANFRPVPFTSGKIFRSASPCDNERNRTACVDGLCRNYGIKSIIDLAENEKEADILYNDDKLNAPYCKELYKSGKIRAIGIHTNEDTLSFRKGMAEAIRLVADAEKPLLIHCKEGKDRTGFAVLILEVLCGADCNDIKKDFMISYQNYFGITADGTPYSYGFCIENYYKDYMTEVFREKALSVLSPDELLEGILQYLADSGLTSDKTENLIKAFHLMQQADN